MKKCKKCGKTLVGEEKRKCTSCKENTKEKAKNFGKGCLAFGGGALALITIFFKFNNDDKN